VVIDAFAAKRKARFPRSEDLVEMKLEINLKDSHKNSSRKVGVKLYSSDGARVIIFRGDQFALIHLAPYTDWDCLYDEAREHWETLAKILKHKNIAYFSTRYVNRIDIPVDSVDGGVDLQKYFNIGIMIPLAAKTLRLESFATTTTLVAPDEAYRFLVTFSSVPSPLIDCLSFLVNIDLITSGAYPKKDDEAWAFVKSLRSAKNALFEACITDETRKFFQ
jgi:uncharacterized protein (TIGR04255 family)